jgi:hypothetical protein
MNFNEHNSFDRSGSESDRFGPEPDRASTGEDTLRLIAALPAPEGLERRVHAVLRAAPRQGRVLAWPTALRVDAAWVRATAAAAIVMVVAGGGWSVYSHIQPWQPTKAPGAPARVGAMNGFSGAGAMRSPQTLQPPVLSAPPKSALLRQSQKKTHKKAATATTQTVTAAPTAK